MKLRELKAYLNTLTDSQLDQDIRLIHDELRNEYMLDAIGRDEELIYAGLDVKDDNTILMIISEK